MNNEPMEFENEQDDSRMDMQTLTFFTEGNTFTGCRTKNPRTKLMMRYLVKPDKENDRLLAYSWNTDVCFECSGEKAEAAFPLSDEGIDEVQLWLQERYAELAD